LQRLLEQLCVSVYAFVSLKRHAANETLKGVAAAHEKLIDVLVEGTAKQIEAALEEHLRPESSIPASVSD
jgi:DNA-binding FadR family transcriptional regulator